MTATETPTCIVSIKIVAHTFAAETFTCINAAETSDCIIATETVTCIIATESVSCIVPTEASTCAELTTETFTSWNGAGMTYL